MILIKFLGCRDGGENPYSLNGGKIFLRHVGTNCHITRRHTAEDPGRKIKWEDKCRKNWHYRR